MAKMAEKTCTLLFDRIQNPEKKQIEQAVFPTTFVPRESIGRAP
jgi:DNA-binding LacI/PurR family transcriptional regulator